MIIEVIVKMIRNLFLLDKITIFRIGHIKTTMVFLTVFFFGLAFLLTCIIFIDIFHQVIFLMVGTKLKKCLGIFVIILRMQVVVVQMRCVTFQVEVILGNLLQHLILICVQILMVRCNIFLFNCNFQFFLQVNLLESLQLWGVLAVLVQKLTYSSVLKQIQMVENFLMSW